MLQKHAFSVPSPLLPIPSETCIFSSGQIQNANILPYANYILPVAIMSLGSSEISGFFFATRELIVLKQ